MDTTGRRFSRRGLLGGLAATPAALTLGGKHAEAETTTIATTIAQTQAALKGAKGTKLVLLGTGAGPVPGGLRHMTAHVLVHNGATYIVDCGLGVSRQFARTGVPWRSVRSIFITHHHPDHNIEYGPMLVMGWLGGMPQNVRAYGPTPLKQMTEDFLRSARTTIDFWAEDFHTKPLEMIDVHELPQEGGPVMQDDTVKVTSVVVQHPPVKPAYGYRFDFPDRSIAFSGDTVALDAVATMAKGADVLVHEAMDMAAIEAFITNLIAHGAPGNVQAYMTHMHADHTPTEEVGRIAQEAGVKTLVLSHLGPGDFSVGDARWRGDAAKHFKGKIIVGRDLMVV